MGEKLPRRQPFVCACGERRRDEFRDSEPFRCKACRRAYNAKRHAELRKPVVVPEWRVTESSARRIVLER